MIVVLGVVGLLICGIALGIWLSAVQRFNDPMRSFYSIPPFTRTTWMDDAHVANYERLINDVSRRRTWSDEDVAFVMSLLEAPRMSRQPPIPLDDVQFSFFSATPDQIASFRERDGADAALDWYFRTFERSMAWSIVEERLRLDLEIPYEMRRYVLEARATGLDDDDPSVRMESVSSLIYSRAIEDPNLRMRVEAVRLGDPSADVRRLADQHLQHYDRIYSGVEPSGPTSECNTCP